MKNVKNKKKKKWFCLLTVLLVLFPAPVTLHAAESESDAADRTQAPYFLIESADPATDRFPLKDTKVSTNIDGVIAETYVTQTYANEGQNPISASYIFPASTKVTVHGMKMTVGNQVVTAQIKEKEEAKETFEEAKSEGKSASLLEEQRPNVFSMDVANIMPGDTIQIELHYTELIIATENTNQFVFPTVVGPRYVSQVEGTDTQELEWVDSPYIPEDGAAPGTYDISVALSAGVPISSLKCDSHKINIAWTDSTAARVTLADPNDFAGNRDYILEYRLTGETINSGLMLDRSGEENYFMLTIQPPERFTPQDIPPREYIFVLDVSGSMYGFPLDTAKELIKNLITNLRETDTFNLLLFSGASSLMAPKSLAATADNIEKATELIENTESGGGTELAPALESAVAIPQAVGNENASRSIIVISDGFIWGESEIFEIVKNNLDTTSFFSFGIGDAVNRYLIEGIAKAGLGEAFVVTDPAEAAETAERFRTYIQSPILTDINVTFSGFDVYDVEPKRLPTLFAQRPIVLFGKWRGEPTGTALITGKTGAEDYRQEINLAEITPSTGKALRYLWARTRIDTLTDYGINEDKPEVKEEVTAIGLNYSMMTPYTSFVAVLETVRNPDGDSTDVEQPNPLPLNVSNLAIGYTVGSEPGEILLILAAVAAIFISLRKKLSRRWA